MKKVVITGGTGGVGKHIVEQFCKNGYHVIFTYVGSEDQAKRIEMEYDAKGFCVDSSDIQSIVNFTEKLSSEYENIDALVYAAGIFEDSLVINTNIDSWDRVININLRGAFLYTKHLLPLIRKSLHGRVIYIGSVVGETGLYGSASYSTSKAALIGLAKSVALEEARYNITANVVSFGYINAGMTARVSDKVLGSVIKKIPAKKLGDPDDTARVIVGLCNDYTDYITGQVIRINGGLYV